jgi:rod shape-determining protein MreB and related proteins
MEPKMQNMQKGTVFVGMDLGTFKTSVASSSGVRDVLFSAVGWPRDHVARTMLGRDVVFGQDLVEQRLALNVVRPFEKGVLKFNEQARTKENAAEIDQRKEAARMLVEHAVSLTRPPKGVPIFGVIGAPSRASVANKKIILDAARSSFAAAMIVSEPFSLAYGMNRLTDTLVIDIGAGTIDLCPIYGTFPKDEDQVTIPIGGDFIDEQFYSLMRKTYPDAQLSWNMAREIKEKYGFVHDGAEKIVVNLPVNGEPKPFDVTEPLKTACRMLVNPILQGLRELIGRFDPEFQSRMLNNIVLGGGGSQLKGLDRIIEESLKTYGGGKVKRVGDAVFAGAVGALKLAMGLPEHCWNDLSTTPPEPKTVAA